MNYNFHYNSLIEKAKMRSWDKNSSPQYVERHHIIPRCLGGNNNKENLVYLTYREHCLAHLLLSKIYQGNYKLLCAVKRMYQVGKDSRRVGAKILPDKIREQHAIAASLFFKGRPKGPFSDEHKKNLSLSHKGRKDTDWTRKKKSLSLTGKIVKEETRIKNKLARARQLNGGDKRVYVLGSEYKSIGEAERMTGISRFNIWRRINLSSYTEYHYL